MVATTPTPGGRIVGGKYRVEGLLGEGRTGMLVAATHLALRELVAIKLVRAGGRVSPERALARFSRQARALAKIRSEHVARVHDVGMLEDGRGAYMVLEYLEGQDLAAWVRDAGALPIERSVFPPSDDRKSETFCA